MSKIKITSSNPYFQNILDEFEDFEDRITSKKSAPKVVVLPDDPVVLACASYRMYQENPRHRWLDFNQVVVWQDDREEAERLKAYYREAFKETTFKMLKSTRDPKLSSFRHKLYLLANGDLQITDREIGMLYRLPYFYAEDLALDEVIKATTTISESLPPHKQEVKLTLFKKILRSRSSGETNQYWFKEATNDHAYMLPVKCDNNLAKIFDSLANNTLNIESMVVYKQMQGRPGHTYFQLAGPSLV